GAEAQWKASPLRPGRLRAPEEVRRVRGRAEGSHRDQQVTDSFGRCHGVLGERCCTRALQEPQAHPSDVGCLGRDVEDPDVRQLLAGKLQLRGDGDDVEVCNPSEDDYERCEAEDGRKGETYAKGIALLLADLLRLPKASAKPPENDGRLALSGTLTQSTEAHQKMHENSNRRSVSPNPTKPSPKAKGRASSEAPGRPTGDADEPGPKILEAELVPAWRNKTVQGLFCDPYIENTNLEGGRSSQALSDVIEIGTELLRSAPISMSSTDIQALRAALKQLGAAADRSNAGHDAFEAQDGMRWCQQMQKEIYALRVDETWLVEGGWRGEHGSHAIMYMIQRMSDSEFAFSVLNTGAGIHQFQVCDPSMMGIGKARYRTRLCLAPIKKERLDLPFLYALFRTYFVRHRCHSCAQLYEVLLPLLEADESVDAWPSTPQRAGTCYAKCIFLTLRVLLGHFGLGKDALKKWMLNFRIGYLEKMVSDLQQSCHKLTISDRIILTVALKQVARRCAREAYAVPARGRVHVCLQKIWLAAPPMPWLGYFAAKMEAKEPALQLPKTSSSGLGFQGFQLLVASALIPPEVRNAFAGPSATKSTNPHVDLTGIASASASGPSLEAVLQAALMCDRLEEVLGCSLHSKQLILGVVESLVFWEGQSLWQKDLGQLKLAQGREVLAAIHRLGAHYLAGARSSFLGRCWSSRACWSSSSGF
ncbi:unnamed protein product, partial [Symbiodinium necroappetens]